MKRQALSVILCAAMSAGLLAGCGSAADTTAAATSAAPAAAATSAAAAATSAAAAATSAAAAATSEAAATADSVDYSKDSGDINIFISSPEYADAINALIDQYKTVAPNVTINYETTQNDYPTMLKAKINSGEIPDIFSSTSGMEIDTYKEYSYDLTGQPLTKTMDPSVAEMMKSPSDGSGCYGIAIKGNYFGILYNKDIFDECGITEFPTTASGLKDAVAKIKAKGYKPFTTGYSEWWVFKHAFQSFLNAAADGAGISAADLTKKFQAGEAKISDYPEIYNNFFDFIDMTVANGDDKPLETDLSAEEAAFANGEAAMTVGQGAWIEADCLAINPDLKIGFNGYPVTDDAKECKVISGSDQALHVYKDSKNLQAVLDFVNYWYTSDYGTSWFTDVAKVVPPITTAKASDLEVIQQGSALVSSTGSGALSICYSTDSWWQTFGQLMQDYIGGKTDKDATCKAIEEQWKAIDGASN
jgi:raffinose/stachyose/melibiose transport system substrate-binding protein